MRWLRLIVLGAVAAAAFGCAKSRGPSGRTGPIAPEAAKASSSLLDQDFDLASLGVETYPKATQARGAGAVAAPMPEGTAYTVRLRTTDTGEQVLAFYRRSLREPATLDKTVSRSLIVGRSRYGDEVTVLVDPREIIIKNIERGTETKHNHTDVVITVRRVRASLKAGG